MPLDTQIARFLADTAGAAAPGSLAEMRAAAEAGLLQLQGEAEASGGVRDFTVTANDGHDAGRPLALAIVHRNSAQNAIGPAVFKFGRKYQGFPQEGGGRLIHRSQIEILRRTHLRQPAIAHHRDLIGKRQRFRLIVGHQN